MLKFYFSFDFAIKVIQGFTVMKLAVNDFLILQSKYDLQELVLFSLYDVQSGFFPNLLSFIRLA